MSWMMLAALGMIWAAFLLPSRRGSPNRSVEEFGRKMELLAETERVGQGRWIVTPRKGLAFIGPRARAQVRARERRRRVFVFLIESIVLTLLIGLVPPLRVMWYGTAGLVALLGIYVWVLVTIKNRSAQARVVDRTRAAAVPARARAVSQRYVAEGRSRNARRAWGGLGALGADDGASIVVKPAGGARVAGV